MVDQPSLFSQPQNLDDMPDMKPLKEIVINKDLPGVQLLDLVPNDAQLALNRNYPQREIHVGRILNLLSEKEKLNEDVTRNEIIDVISMSWASAQGTINVMRKALLIDANTRITSLGKLITIASPYLDDIGLLWLLHYILASNAKLVLWSNLFNFLLQTEDEFSTSDASDSFQVLIGKWSEQSIREKARNEISAIFLTYTDELFSKLRLIQKNMGGTYQTFYNIAPIPKLIWLSAIMVYRDRYYPGASALEAPLLYKAHYCPGRILLKSEAEVRKALDELHDAGFLTVEKRLGLDQVRFKRDITWFSAIKRYFQEK